MRPPADWPNRHISQTRRGPVHDWHYQLAGSGPDILVLHGAGGSTHSMAELSSLLANTYRVLTPDLPGHGFTKLGALRRSSLHHMAEDIAALSAVLEVQPTAIIGHSAGAAIALQLSMERYRCKVLAINPALQNFDGLAGIVFPAMAKMLNALPFTAKLFSGVSSDETRLRKLIASTGSVLRDDQVALYRRLVSHEPHVSGALAMMAQWSLADLLSKLRSFQEPCLFLVGENDSTVPPDVARHAAKNMPNANVQSLGALGHLAHEEDPNLVVQSVRDFLNGSIKSGFEPE